MTLTLGSLADLDMIDCDEILDVRSPSEFAEDHLPGAVNLPVLDDEERARVGTIYTRESPFRARRIGAGLIARNAARHLEDWLCDKPKTYRPLIYCWRGGQRSGALATILRQVGWRAETLEGGYKAYRRCVVDALYRQAFPAPVVLVDGNTGTAKTDLLHLLAAAGDQVLDLEGLANHRGSMFGARPGGQPAQKGFESAVAGQLRRLDPARPVFIEAESSKVGDRELPPILWAAMRVAPRVVLEAPRAERAAYLVRAYRDIAADPARLDRLIEHLAPYHSREVITAWRSHASEGALERLACELMAAHYDPRYARQRARMAAGQIRHVRLDGLTQSDLEAALPEIRAAGGSLLNRKDDMTGSETP